MYCENCGAKIDDDSRYCINCGHIIENSQDKFNCKGMSKKSGMIRNIVVIVVIICVVMVSIFAISKIIHNSGEEHQKNSEVSLRRESRKEEDSSAAEDFENSAGIESDNSEVLEDYSDMEEQIENYCEVNLNEKDYSFYVSILDDSYEYDKNSHPSRAGQSGRIFVIEYITEAIGDGRMQSSDKILDIIRTTATGDEPSSYELVKTITGDFAEGLDLVDDYVVNEGYSDTTINRFNGDAGNHTDKSPNQTSARDTGRSITHIFKMASEGNRFATEVLQILGTEASSKAGIASTVRASSSDAEIYNFAASYTACENDMAVIEYKGKVFVISFMIGGLSENGVEHDSAFQNMHKLVDIVWSSCISKVESS